MKSALRIALGVAAPFVALFLALVVWSAVRHFKERYALKQARDALLPEEVVDATCGGWDALALPDEGFDASCSRPGGPGARLSWVCPVGPGEWIFACEFGGIAYHARVFHVTQRPKVDAEARPLRGPLPPPKPDCSQARALFDSAPRTP